MTLNRQIWRGFLTTVLLCLPFFAGCSASSEGKLDSVPPQNDDRWDPDETGYDPWPEPDPNTISNHLDLIDIGVIIDIHNDEDRMTLQTEQGSGIGLRIDKYGVLNGSIQARPGEILSFVYSIEDSDDHEDNVVTAVAEIDTEDAVASSAQVSCLPDCRFGVRIPDSIDKTISLIVTVRRSNLDGR